VEIIRICSFVSDECKPHFVAFEANSAIQTIEIDAFYYNNGSFNSVRPEIVIPGSPIGLKEVIMDGRPYDRVLWENFELSPNGKFMTENSGKRLCYYVGRQVRIVVDSSVEVIGRGFLARNRRVRGIVFAQDSRLRVLEESAFSASPIEYLNIPRTVEVIEAQCFSSCSKLREVTFEKGSQLRVIGEHAFSPSGIERIVIPKNVEVIKHGCFSNSRLREVRFEEGSHLKEIGCKAFSVTRIVDIVIPKSVEAIGDRCFDCNSGLWMVRFENGTKLGNVTRKALMDMGLTQPVVQRTIKTMEQERTGQV
jgi:hypothetical protein